ncbi:MAG TPA: PqqD family peptide modification chaperone [Acidimicrobiales bacterium]|nr:PqqD family peptide modification chaperone [Acidimicrobiales bacterium]
MRRRLFGRARHRRGPEPGGPAQVAPCEECAKEGVRPFGLLAPPEPLVTAGDVLARTSGRLETVVDGQLVEFDPGTGNAHLLNPSAALVLTSVDGRRTVGEIADELADETGVDRHVILRDVTDTLGTLLQGGLVTWFLSESAPVEGERGRSTTHDRWAQVVERRLDARDWPHVGPPRLAAGAGVLVRTDDEEVARRLDDALDGLPAATSGSEVAMLSVDRRVVAGSIRFRVHAAGERVGWADDRGHAIAFALAGLNRLAAEGTHDRLLLHAGAVERDGRVAVIAGPSGRGKSTLTAALVRAGARYLSDELAVVDPVTGDVTAYPKPFELDGDAVARLGLHDVVAPGPGPTPTGGIVGPTDVGEVGTGGVVALLVLLDAPERGPSGTVDPVELGPADAMLRLLRDVLPVSWSVPGVLDGLAALCERVPALLVPRVDLDDAVGLVLDRLAAAGGNVGRDAP